MEPQDITRIKWVSDPQISPDGSRVAYVVTTLDARKDEYRSAIWVDDRQLTRGPKRDSAPRWSPDGKCLAFVSEREEKKRGQLYVLPIDGGEARRLTDLSGGVGEPAWSPDGTRIAFTSRVGPDYKDDKPVRVIRDLKYKMNGEGYVYDRRPHVFVVAADGSTEPRQITYGDYADAGPSWSPDGTEIAFASARHATRDEDQAADVFVVSALGGEPRQLTPTEGPVRSVAWSPDGKTIAYLGHRDAEDWTRNTMVMAVPAAGGPMQALSEKLDRNAPGILASAPLRWTDDSRALLCAFEDRADQPIYRVGVDGSIEKLIGGERWITGVSCANGRIAYTATDPLSPPEVFLGDRQVSDLNREWKGQVALSRPERFTFERDRFTIDGWVMKPCGYEPDKKYPTLLNIHGGPATQYGHTFFDEFQVYAGAGYAVVFTNPRGSHGYGEAFVRDTLGTWGDGDYQDVMAGMDAALERFDFIDRDRLGVMGGSYGGYMTSWTIGHTDRFKAACSERALNDWWSFFGTADIGASFPEQMVRALPWEDPEKYLRQSPLYYAKDIKTPLLIIHSEDDLRCPIEQGEALFVALKKLGREVVFVRFPDENHEMSRSGKPKHRLQRFELILDWFGRHLA